MKTNNFKCTIIFILIQLVAADKCPFEKITWKYYRDKRCTDEDEARTKKYNDHIKDFSAVKIHMNDDCQKYDGKWVKWDCDVDKMSLQEYKDSNPISDQDFIDEYLVSSTEADITKKYPADKWYKDPSDPNATYEMRQCTQKDE